MSSPVNKVRSPNYPMIDLRDAVKRIKVVHDNIRMHPAPRATVASTLGYKSLNGTSMSVVSALTKYGLLESAGDQFKVSIDAREILLHRTGEQPRVGAIRKAAFLPALFNELHEKYGDDVPSDHLLTSYLKRKEFNENTIPGVIRIYRDTMDFVNEESLENDDWLQDSVVEEPVTTPVAPNRAESPRAATAVAPVLASRDVLVDPGWTTSKELRFTLLDGAEVRALFQGLVTQESIDMFTQLLNISKRGFPETAPVPVALTEREDPTDDA